MTRYLLVTGDFVKTGGMDRANFALANYLIGRGDPVELVAFRVEESLLTRPNVTWHRVPKPLGSYLLGHPVLDHHGRRHARRFSGRVIVNGGNCRWGDVNWLHHLNIHDAPNASGSFATRARRHLAHRLYVREERACLMRAQTIITTCAKNRTQLLDWLDIDPARVEVVYYGTDPEVFHPATPDEKRALRARLGWPEDRPALAFVGALGDRRKGFDTLFDAWTRLCADPGWDADLVVVGDGAERPAWEARAVEAGLSARFRFLGFRRDVPDLFRACDGHVLPSRYEGYSLVTQEALCCGLPAFVTASAGIAERFPAALYDLLIPDPDDAADLARRLRAWRDRPEGFATALDAFSSQLRAETWDQMAARMARLVEGGETYPQMTQMNADKKQT